MEMSKKVVTYAKNGKSSHFSSVQSLSHVQPFVTPWTAARQAFLYFTISLSLLRLMSIESVMPSNHLILCHLLLLPSIFPRIGVFSSESVLSIRWSKYGASDSASVLTVNIQDWFPLELTGLVSLLSKGLSGIFSNTMVQKHQFFSAQWWFSWQEYMSRLLCPPPGDFPNPRIEPRSARCRWILYRRCHEGSLVSL